MGSRWRPRLRSHGRPDNSIKMDAIKKKMQAMKVEKDNACDRTYQVEEQSKQAKIRAEKAEDEVAELAAKARQLETELDLTTERLGIVTLQLEEKEKTLAAAELEMNALNRRVSGLEEDLEKTGERLLTLLMRRLPRILLLATATWRRPRRELMLESRRSWSWRRSSGWWPTTSSPWRWRRRRPTRGRSLTRSRSRR